MSQDVPPTTAPLPPQKRNLELWDVCPEATKRTKKEDPGKEPDDTPRFSGYKTSLTLETIRRFPLKLTESETADMDEDELLDHITDKYLSEMTLDQLHTILKSCKIVLWKE
jgi:hypothetical protein